MKTLQNNFTTPEQSKRLLELGVPANSADCFICTNAIGQDTGILDFPYSEIERECFLPCWSVGRLIEIIGICEDSPATLIQVRRFECIDYLIKIIETLKDNKYIDFSKLEE